MSLLRGTSPAIETLFKKLDPWINNVPDFHDVKNAYEDQGKQRKKIKLLEREINKVEDGIVQAASKPRSNEVRQEKLQATVELKDQLADLYAELEVMKAHTKLLEYHKNMFSSAMYRMKLQSEL